MKNKSVKITGAIVIAVLALLTPDLDVVIIILLAAILNKLIDIRANSNETDPDN